MSEVSANGHKLFNDQDWEDPLLSAPEVVEKVKEKQDDAEDDEVEHSPRRSEKKRRREEDGSRRVAAEPQPSRATPPDTRPRTDRWRREDDVRPSQPNDDGSLGLSVDLVAHPQGNQRAPRPQAEQRAPRTEGEERAPRPDAERFVRLEKKPVRSARTKSAPGKVVRRAMTDKRKQ